MTTPRRLIDADDDFERELIRSAHADRPAERAFERMLLGLGVEFSKLPAAIANPAPAVATSGKLGTAILVKGLATGMAIGLAAAGGAHVVSRAFEPPSPQAPTTPVPIAGTALPPTALVRAPKSPSSEPTPAIAQAPSSVPSSSVRSRLASTSAAPSRPGSEAGPTGFSLPSQVHVGSFASETDPTLPRTLTEEMRLLDQARRALANGDARLALSNLESHARAFPNGALGPEASVLKVRALLAAGDRTSADALGQRIIERAPHSEHADAVRSALGLRTNP